MQQQSRAATAAELERHFATNGYAHAADIAELVLESYGAGSAWLRPDTVRDPEPDDALWTITDRGRRALRELDLFGPWPTVSAVLAEDHKP